MNDELEQNLMEEFVV